MKTISFNRPISPAVFFYKWAGWGFNPITETRKQGRSRCAKRLAEAEVWGQSVGVHFDWSIDQDCDSSDFAIKGRKWSLWQCTARDKTNAVVASLGGIDFGRNGVPWGEPYKRVVEAELSLEAMPG